MGKALRLTEGQQQTGGGWGGSELGQGHPGAATSHDEELLESGNVKLREGKMGLPYQSA